MNEPVKQKDSGNDGQRRVGKEQRIKQIGRRDLGLSNRGSTALAEPSSLEPGPLWAREDLIPQHTMIYAEQLMSR